MKLFMGTGLTLIILSALALFELSIVFAQSGLVVVIDSDTTWTKANSPYNITGPLLVKQGITLTVEAGAIVNLNGYEMRINGTLRAVGTSTNKIFFENGIIRFTEYSEAWNEQTETGSIIQFGIFENLEIFTNVPVSINDNPVSEDNVWSKQESPIEFTKPVVIDEDKTLTIEAGVTINMNGYDLVIKGELRALGNPSERIYFNGGTRITFINFTETSKEWNEETTKGSLLNNIVTHFVAIFSSSTVKIANSNLERSLAVDDKSVVLNNTINEFSINGGAVICVNNNINTITACYGTPEILNNTIEVIVGSGGSPIISGNTIREFGRQVPEDYTFDEIIEIEWVKAESPTITNNTIQRGLYLDANNPTITYNTITGYTYNYTKREIIPEVFPWWSYPAQLQTSGITLTGRGHVEGNTISGCNTGIKGGTVVVRNVLNNNLIGASVELQTLIQNNTFRENKLAIESKKAPAEITDNAIISNEIGIVTSNTTIIERNFFQNCDLATKINPDSTVTIKNNTYSGNKIAIELNTPDSIFIEFNNFENINQSSISLMNTSRNFVAKNNWWGTTDAQSINLTIYDSKYSFDLGTVSFTPFLMEKNPEALPRLNPIIPEFPSWLILPFLLGVTLAVAVIKKKML